MEFNANEPSVITISDNIEEKQIIVECFVDGKFQPPLGEVCNIPDTPIVDFVSDTLSSFNIFDMHIPTIMCFVFRHGRLIRIRSTSFVRNDERVYVCQSTNFTQMEKKIMKERKNVAPTELSCQVVKSECASGVGGSEPVIVGATKRQRTQLGSNTQERLEFHLANKTNPNYAR